MGEGASSSAIGDIGFTFARGGLKGCSDIAATYDALANGRFMTGHISEVRDSWRLQEACIRSAMQTSSLPSIPQLFDRFHLEIVINKNAIA